MQQLVCHLIELLKLPQVSVSCAQAMARRRQLRHCSSLPHVLLPHTDAAATVQPNRFGSSILERQPKVQLLYHLQGCVSEAAHLPVQSEQHSNKVLTG